MAGETQLAAGAWPASVSANSCTPVRGRKKGSAQLLASTRCAAVPKRQGDLKGEGLLYGCGCGSTAQDAQKLGRGRRAGFWGSRAPEYWQRPDKRLAFRTAARVSCSAAGGFASDDGWKREDGGGGDNAWIEDGGEIEVNRSWDFNRSLQEWRRKMVDSENVWGRMGITLGIVLLARMLALFPAPGFQQNAIVPGLKSTLDGSELIGALQISNARLLVNIVQLGVSPFIEAQFTLSLLFGACKWGMPIPWLRDLEKNKDFHMKERLGLYLGWAMAAVGAARTIILHWSYMTSHQIGNIFLSWFSLTVGALTVLGMANWITAYGVGQGESVFICVSIIWSYASSLEQLFLAWRGGLLNGSILGVLCGGFLLFTVGIVFLSGLMSRVPITFYDPSPSRKRVSTGLVDDYIPLMGSPGGMIPVLFASECMGGLSSFVGWLNTAQDSSGLDRASFLYNLGLFVLVFGFNLIMSTKTADDLSSYLTRIDARVPGVRPGKRTMDYLRGKQLDALFWGSLALGCLTVAARVAENVLYNMSGINVSFTSLLIVVNVVAHMRKQVVAYSQIPSFRRFLARYIF